MSWIQTLYETYNNCENEVGYSTDQNRRPFLPICHMTAQANIEIIIDDDGNFKDAHFIMDKNEATTIIPCTETSGSRSGKMPEGHPLCDQLQYVTGDFNEYGGQVTSGFSADPRAPFVKYISDLSKWCETDYVHPKVLSILKYVKKESTIRDLVNHQILIVSDKKFIKKAERKKKKNDPSDIFDAVSSQDKAFIRWIVQSPDVLEIRTWKDKSLWESWIKYYLSTKTKKSLCYVTGKDALLAKQHPKYIRIKGDGAKIISSNDTSGFTYRGRFTDKTGNQACGVSLEVSQKAHNALMWLINRQGKVFGEKNEPGIAVVAWATSGKIIPPQPTDDASDILDIDNLPPDVVVTSYVAQDIGNKLKSKILGYKADISESNLDGIQIIALDSASKGRLAITYYRELKGSDYLERIDKWHEDCSWIHTYSFNKEKQKHFPFVGAPAPSDIAAAAYGKRLDNKLKKTTIERLLPCIIDKQPIPRDIVESAVRRACNRITLDDWEWNKTLSIACSLFKKYNTKENYNMALDENRTTRDYLYGRLLAIADRLEEVALYKGEKDRPTHAARYMQIFSERPNRTWKQIYLSLTPYLQMSEVTFYKNKIDEVKWKFVSPEEFNLDTPLTGEFLLAYHCQRMELRQYKGNKSKVKNDVHEESQDGE